MLKIKHFLNFLNRLIFSIFLPLSIASAATNKEANASLDKAVPIQFTQTNDAIKAIVPVELTYHLPGQSPQILPLDYVLTLLQESGGIKINKMISSC